jgi:hypothetical protein
MNREVYNRKVETREELPALILDSAMCIKIREDQLRLTTPDLCTRIAKCIEVDGGIFLTFVLAFIWNEFDI